ncbi:MAG: flavoprotein, partial [Pseudonocardia sp.]|nr:flavoprotein [Pseudonocardia sp.]
MSRTLGLVASASGGIERIRQELVEPLMADDWQVAITLTPTAGVWL